MTLRPEVNTPIGDDVVQFDPQVDDRQLIGNVYALDKAMQSLIRQKP